MNEVKPAPSISDYNRTMEKMAEFLEGIKELPETDQILSIETALIKPTEKLTKLRIDISTPNITKEKYTATYNKISNLDTLVNHLESVKSNLINKDVTASSRMQFARALERMQSQKSEAQSEYDRFKSSSLNRNSITIKPHDKLALLFDPDLN
jgi:cob(I)alamin adenosyltransferase